MVTICPKTKRWWTRKLTTLHQQANKLGRHASKLDHHPTHPIHKEHKKAKRCYHNMLENTKRQDWHDWLERAEDPDLWTAHKYLSAPAGNGGKARIPTLKFTEDSKDTIAATNEDKGRLLAKAFFPWKPETDITQEENTYPPPVCTMDPLTKAQIEKHLCKLKPYKAPGPDGIPNIILTKCADILLSRLYYIYMAMSDRKLFYAPWKSFTMVVLRKPGKPRYDLPKAYRPIMLLNTM
jgi:hypothetical protein